MGLYLTLSSEEFSLGYRGGDNSNRGKTADNYGELGVHRLPAYYFYPYLLLFESFSGAQKGYGSSTRLIVDDHLIGKWIDSPRSFAALVRFNIRPSGSTPPFRCLFLI
ncbi:hypothetical protein PCH_Pc16g07260 [Penicillium rubens Wisconsin 54-1255]|uniref:Uncharacterized protein n=1 Tax=Penicillium rubens (strain ATCC 28089 / DSM 1075 / NRRL 1951 / Wisconsin 54-1255) TaxID=500485 RepID=B6H7E4_PENRW|nr:hypothetical protein PCH_Pc16g07260 [Penicillium rubens Wisconsin 54-1255]